jgi:hypothetical protein
MHGAGAFTKAYPRCDLVALLNAINESFYKIYTEGKTKRVLELGRWLDG